MRSFTCLNDKLEPIQERLSSMWSEIPTSQIFTTEISTDLYPYYVPSLDSDAEVTHWSGGLKTDWYDSLYKLLQSSLYSVIVDIVNEEAYPNIEFDEIHEESPLNDHVDFLKCKECDNVELMWDDINIKIADAVCYESSDSVVIKIIEDYEKSHKTTVLSTAIESCYEKISKELDALYRSVKYFAEQEINEFDNQFEEWGIPDQLFDLFFQLADAEDGMMPDAELSALSIYHIDDPIKEYLKWCETHETDPQDEDSWSEFVDSLGR